MGAAVASSFIAAAVGGAFGAVGGAFCGIFTAYAYLKYHIKNPCIDDPDFQAYGRALETASTIYNNSNRPTRLIFLRHGESKGNLDSRAYSTTPDNAMPLAPAGWEQAIETGRKLRDLVGDESICFFLSPYRRTKETFQGIKEGGKFLEEKTDQYHVVEDMNLREQEFGNFQDPEQICKDMHIRNSFGRFWFRFANGESGADVYGRISLFLGTLFRSMDNSNKIKYTNYVIVTHGLTMRLFMMRFFRWSIPDFESVWNPGNCEMWILEREARNGDYVIKNAEDIRCGSVRGLPERMIRRCSRPAER